jgi:restriction endonuclease Mrr
VEEGLRRMSGRNLAALCLLVSLLVIGLPLLVSGPPAGEGLGRISLPGIAVVAGIVAALGWLDRAERKREREEELKRQAEAERRRLEEQRHQEELKRLEEQRHQEELKRLEERERQRIESLLRRDAVGDEINYMSGVEFERFMADVFRQKGYGVQSTRASGDQGVDLLLDIDDKKVAVQLKRWTAPVGNAVVGATFAGIAHYGADEGWIITTSTFTRSARALARSTRVRLIDGKELGDWLEGLREQE